jgi:hypothetical protein
LLLCRLLFSFSFSNQWKLETLMSCQQKTRSIYTKNNNK